MSVLALAGVSLRRVARDRMALFFMVVLPVVIILVIGLTVRGFSTFRVGVVDLGAGRAGGQLVAALGQEHDLVLQRYPTVTAASRAVARAEVATAVVLPRGMDASLRAGRAVDIRVLAERSNSTQQAAAAAVSTVVERTGARVQAALFATAHVGGTFTENLERAAGVAPHVVQVRVVDQVADRRADVLPQGFSYSAPTMLVLFVFVNGLAAGANVVDTRRLGIYERMSAGPVRPIAIIAGEGLAYLAVAVLQAVLIVGVGFLAFGVSWGDPVAAAALVLTWAAVGTGAGLLSGSLFRTPEQATAVGPTIGIAFGMLGGCMWPLSIVTSVMRQVGHVTPHAWAVDAWTALLARHGTLATIAPELLVLAAFAAGLVGLATFRLHRMLS